MEKSKYLLLDDRWHLPIDDYAFARLTGFDRVIHHPRPMGVVIPADKPWETFGAAMYYVDRRDDSTFIGFYQAMWWDPALAKANKDAAHHIRGATAYATSPDGIHWDKPDLGLVEGPAGVDGSAAPFPTPRGSTKQNNLGVPFAMVQNLGRYGNVSDPGKRYALRLAPPANTEIGSAWKQEPRGYFAAELPDFLNHPHWRDQLTDSHSQFNPRRHTVSFWDDIHHEWVAMEQGVTPHWLPSREVGRMASKDLVHWTSQAALYPDAADPHTPHCYDEPMNLGAFCAEGVVFGLLSWFHSDRTTGESGGILEPSPQHPHVWPWYRKGTNEIRITLSRDGGTSWDRTSSRVPWIAHGREEDAYDRCVLGCLAPLRVGGEDWFYVNVMDGDHLVIRNNPRQNPYYHNRIVKHQTALYIQKHNRYVSLRAGNQSEVLITKPMVFHGDTLQLNVDAGHGCVRVGIALAEPVGTLADQATCSTAAHLYEKKLIDGLGFNDCPPIHADCIDHAVQFNGGPNLEPLNGKPVVLMFEMVDADLYGFRAV